MPDEELKFEKIIEKLKFPMFVKPSNSGSSVGVKKANDVNELKLAIENASKYDRKIIIEEGIKGKEVECAILEKKDEIIASTVGEIKSAEEFYSFDAKYNIPNSQTIIPAKIEKNLIEEIQKNAIKAFKSIDGRGLARVDFFIEEGTNNIYICNQTGCPHADGRCRRPCRARCCGPAWAGDGRSPRSSGGTAWVRWAGPVPVRGRGTRPKP